ncbi:hypothetical protein Glove_117g471 [Diversispora epigaea]|uniref:Uncharacterized protein n=1 Tax=Diversispora epigaea TaxID=1348612 RepID=A0A397J0J1_9GLOM|nr:hypothetical protein Glove_117g471 [Diversispora epigaea]
MWRKNFYPHARERITTASPKIFKKSRVPMKMHTSYQLLPLNPQARSVIQHTTSDFTSLSHPSFSNTNPSHKNRFQDINITQIRKSLKISATSTLHLYYLPGRKVQQQSLPLVPPKHCTQQASIRDT